MEIPPLRRGGGGDLLPLQPGVADQPADALVALDDGVRPHLEAPVAVREGLDGAAGALRRFEDGDPQAAAGQTEGRREPRDPAPTTNASSRSPLIAPVVANPSPGSRCSGSRAECPRGAGRRGRPCTGPSSSRCIPAPDASAPAVSRGAGAEQQDSGQGRQSAHRGHRLLLGLEAWRKIIDRGLLPDGGAGRRGRPRRG